MMRKKVSYCSFRETKRKLDYCAFLINNNKIYTYRVDAVGAERNNMYIHEIPGIDDIDKKILHILEHDARKSYSDIAEEVGLTRVAVKNRIDVLEKKEIIKEYKTVIDPTGDPNGIKFIVDIEAIPEKMEDIVETLALFKFNREIYTVSGECHIHVVGFAPNYATYKVYVAQVFKAVKGARRISCNQMLVTHKDVDGGIDYVRYKESEYMEGDQQGESAAE